MNQAMISNRGFQCPVKGCDKKLNRKFSAQGLTMHFIAKHPGELEKRLRLKVI